MGAFRGVQLAEGEVTADLFGFLTINDNAEVGAVHPRAMPVILTREEELDTWLAAPLPEAHGCSALYRRATGRLVPRGEKTDAAVQVGEETA